MAVLDFEHTINEVWLIEDNGTEHFYMTLEEYEKSLNRPTTDITQQKLDLTLDILAELLIDGGVF